MESSKAFDVPHGVLSPETEKRLVRVFCFLRQHELKARAARKATELQRLSRIPVAAATRSSVPPTSTQHWQSTDASRNADDRGGDGSSSGVSDTHADRTDRSGCGSLDSLDTCTASTIASTSNRETENDPGASSSASTTQYARTQGYTAVSKAEAEMPATHADERCLLNELSLMSPEVSGEERLCGASATPVNTTHQQQQQLGCETRTHMLELGREIRELRKGILPAPSCSWCVDSSLPGCISAADIVSAMKVMNRTPSKTEVQWMIWEADDDLDGCIDWHEFRNCYARVLVDKHGLEPNQLFHFAQFLLCDTDESHAVSVLEIKAELKKLSGTDHLAAKLLEALKDDAEQQLLQKFTLSEYLDAMLSDLPPAFAKFC